MRRFALLCLLVVGAGIGTGVSCNRVESRSGPGLPCSISDDDNPHYTCDPRLDLVCINTSIDRAYYCRVPCEIGARNCEGEYCCPGKTHGNATFGGKTFSHGCTPYRACNAPMDGGGADVGEGGSSQDGAASDGLLGN